MALTAATAQTAMAAAAATAPGLARMLSQLTRLIGCEKRANRAGSAPRATCRRYATASSALEEQLLRTCSRSSGGSGASDTRPKSAAGRRAPGP
jgi:hypothetical protein